MSTCRLLLGDVRDTLQSLPDESVQCVVTSPPYNQLGSRIPANPSGLHSSNSWLAKVSEIGYGDDMDEEEYVAWQVEVAGLLRRVVEPGGSFFYNHKIRYRDGVALHPLDIVRQFDGWHLRQEIVWDRRRAFAFNARMFAPSDERIYWLYRDDAPHRWNQDAVGFCTVWQMVPPVGMDHPCPFPTELARRCIVATTSEGDTVLDPFGGSGTVGMVATGHGRKAILCELNPDYEPLIRKRVGGMFLTVERAA